MRKSRFHTRVNTFLTAAAWIFPAAPGRARAASPADRWQFFAEEAAIGEKLLDLAQQHRDWRGAPAKP
jgi:hypothetical protein